MSRHDEMTRADEIHSNFIFHNVRAGGPKEKRIRRQELMGEHTLKPLHYVKVTQEQTNGAGLLSYSDLQEYFELSIGDVGEAYIPLNSETKEPWDFTLVGFYSQDHATDAADKLNGKTFADVILNVEFVKRWFVELYPKR